MVREKVRGLKRREIRDIKLYILAKKISIDKLSKLVNISKYRLSKCLKYGNNKFTMYEISNIKKIINDNNNEQMKSVELNNSDFFKQNISEEIWRSKYKAVKDKTVFDTFDRIIGTLFDNTDEFDIVIASKLRNMMHENRFLPAGRILSNTGDDTKPIASLINCLVMEQIPDSMNGIMSIAREAALSLQRGNGVGYDFSSIRPKGAYVAGVGADTSGPLPFMEIFNTMAKTIMSAGGRRSAQMGVMDIHHPDIVDFITSKQKEGVLKQFNLSVNITNDFMNQLKLFQKTGDKKYELWELWFWVKLSPTDTVHRSRVSVINKGELPYDLKHRDNNYFVFDKTHIEVKYGNCSHNTIYEKKVFNIIRITELWDIIMRSTYDYAEPGVLFLDRANEYNLLKNYENIRATNPCVVGDTKVAVVNRGAVTIKELADKGEDVMVYAYDNDLNRRVVKRMRRPRLTGENIGVYKILFNSGDSIIVTGNHEILMSNGGYVEAKDLERGSSVHVSQINFDKTSHIEFNPNDYDIKVTRVDDEDVSFIERTCEHCGKSFWVRYDEREKAFCSGKCSDSYTEIKNGWRNNVKSRVDYQNMGTMFEYLVVDIEYVGTRNVYNGTVDDVHNFYVVLDDSDPNNVTMLNNMQCGEQILPFNGACLLGSMNLVKYIDGDSFNFANFYNDTIFANILLDRVVERHGLALTGQIAEITSKRRHGLGFTGLGSMFHILGIDYGSIESIEMTRNISMILAYGSLVANAKLSKISGSFKIDNMNNFIEEFNNSKYYTHLIDNIKSSGFGDHIMNVDTLLNMVNTYGLRYSHATSIAPTGTISLVSNNVSNGIEPPFASAYSRNVVDANDTSISKTERIMDYAFMMAWEKSNMDYDEFLKEYNMSHKFAQDISPSDHIAIQAAAQEFIDSSISKTINCPTNMKFEDFKNIYLEAYDNNLKGLTTFRFNPEVRSAVLITDDDMMNMNIKIMFKDGSSKIYKASDQVEYKGRVVTAYNLYDMYK